VLASRTRVATPYRAWVPFVGGRAARCSGPPAATGRGEHGGLAGGHGLIFLGATAPDASWPVWSVLVLGTVTGGVAGGLLGVVSGWFLPSLTGATGWTGTGGAGAPRRAPPTGSQRTPIGEVRSRLSGRRRRLTRPRPCETT
jgi:hypothetical protein